MDVPPPLNCCSVARVMLGYDQSIRVFIPVAFVLSMSAIHSHPSTPRLSTCLPAGASCPGITGGATQIYRVRSQEPRLATVGSRPLLTAHHDTSAGREQARRRSIDGGASPVVCFRHAKRRQPGLPRPCGLGLDRAEKTATACAAFTANRASVYVHAGTLYSSSTGHRGPASPDNVVYITPSSPLFRLLPPAARREQAERPRVPPQCSVSCAHQSASSEQPGSSL